MHHRSKVGRSPAFLKMIPNQMRKAGYFTTLTLKGYSMLEMKESLDMYSETYK